MVKEGLPEAAWVLEGQIFRYYENTMGGMSRDFMMKKWVNDKPTSELWWRWLVVDDLWCCIFHKEYEDHQAFLRSRQA